MMVVVTEETVEGMEVTAEEKGKGLGEGRRWQWWWARRSSSGVTVEEKAEEGGAWQWRRQATEEKVGSLEGATAGEGGGDGGLGGAAGGSAGWRRWRRRWLAEVTGADSVGGGGRRGFRAVGTEGEDGGVGDGGLGGGGVKHCSSSSLDAEITEKSWWCM